MLSGASEAPWLRTWACNTENIELEARVGAGEDRWNRPIDSNGMKASLRIKKNGPISGTLAG